MFSSCSMLLSEWINVKILYYFYESMLSPVISHVPNIACIMSPFLYSEPGVVFMRFLFGFHAKVIFPSLWFGKNASRELLLPIKSQKFCRTYVQFYVKAEYLEFCEVYLWRITSFKRPAVACFFCGEKTYELECIRQMVDSITLKFFCNSLAMLHIKHIRHMRWLLFNILCQGL